MLQLSNQQTKLKKKKKKTVCEKLCRQDGTVKDAVKANAATMFAPPAKNRRLH